MHNCIFTPHCIELNCDKSCPILAETSNLLERNDLACDEASAHIFNNITNSEIHKFRNMLDSCNAKVYTYVTNDTMQDSAKLTYVAICSNWKNSQLHCTVYNLKYSKYIDELKQSWNRGESDELEYMRIWISSAKVLIISHFDYVNFGDFESQTLLLLLQERQSHNLTTILVSPQIDSLVCTKSSVFFNSLKSKLSSFAKVVSSQ